jgi:hypothetical protein
MQLRTHPKMKWEGFSNWPPAWAGSYGRGDIFRGEEEGVLTGVEMMIEAGNTSPRYLVLTMMHLGRGSSAVLHCDEEEVIPRLFEVLKGCISWEISRIGDLDVDL